MNFGGEKFINPALNGYMWGVDVTNGFGNRNMYYIAWNILD